MQTAENNSQVSTCKTCKCFLGLHPPNPADDNAPFAWCDPYFKNERMPCIPWENASDKPCYSPK